MDGESGDFTVSEGHGHPLVQKTTPVLKEEGKKRDDDAVNEHLLKM